MTAPDDLARTLADEIQRTLHARRCSLRFHGECWTGVSKADADALLDGPLASVVSRRDADLRTRIQDVARALDDLDPYIARLAEVALRPTRAALARALDGETREDTPSQTRVQLLSDIAERFDTSEVPLFAVDDDEFLQCPHEVAHLTCKGFCNCPCDPCAASRVPADTDTGRGQ